MKITATTAAPVNITSRLPIIAIRTIMMVHPDGFDRTIGQLPMASIISLKRFQPI